MKYPETVGSGKKKQEVMIADETGRTTLILWGKNVGQLLPNTSYRLNRIQVAVFAGRHQLQIPRSGYTIEEIEAIDISDLPTEDVNQNQCVESVAVVGVQNLTAIYTCVSCRSNLNQNGSSMLAIIMYQLPNWTKTIG